MQMLQLYGVVLKLFAVPREIDHTLFTEATKKRQGDSPLQIRLQANPKLEWTLGGQLAAFRAL